MNIRSLGFRDIKKCVTIMGVDSTEFRVYHILGVIEIQVVYMSLRTCVQ